MSPLEGNANTITGVTMMNTRPLIRHASSLITSFSLVLFMTLFWSTYGSTGPVRGVTDTTIKIGAIMDLTGPVAGDITLPIAEGLRNYMRHVNDMGGIFGRKIKLIVEDDRYSIPAGLAAFKKLLFRDEIFALFGPASTGEARALFGQIEKLKVPNLTGMIG